MNKIFKYLNQEDNDMLSKMNTTDLQELLYYLKHFYLVLRETLGLDESITFGLEIEFEDAMREIIEKKIRNFPSQDTWIFKNDLSLTRGAEVSSPILTDTKNTWSELKSVCKIIKKDAIIGPNSGGHIHVGTQILKDKTDSWLNLIKLWSVYENIIFRFSYGEYLTGRKELSTHAREVSKDFKILYEQLKTYDNLKMEDIMIRLTESRKQAVNFKNVYNYTEQAKKNTIEFRCPNGTLNPIIWQNNINFFINLLLYCKSSNFNNDIIERRKRETPDNYNEIYLEQALELSDMIFNNNLDKIYFLRQYLKSFKVSDKPLVKARRFTSF